LSDHTTHKDLAGIIRGGRLLDIHLRNDRSATVSFVEGAADFLTYAKRNDIYLHTKRVSITNEFPIVLKLTTYSSNSVGLIVNSMCRITFPTRLPVEQREIF
jgi:hypothetical protein